MTSTQACDSSVPWPQDRWQWVGFLTWFVLTSTVEYFIGKSNKTQASSIIEIMILAFTYLMAKIKTKKESP